MGNAANTTGADATGTARVWDLPVRVTHWLLLLAVIGAWASRKIEGDYFKWHVWCGYAVLLLVATRLVWGFVGTRHARFASFVRGPAAVLRYARALRGQGHETYAGHNPLGALMVLALLATLLVQALTGLFANDQVTETGPLFGHVSSALSDQVTTVHRKLSDLILIAIVLHVGAAFFYLAIRHENLIRPMITGLKPAASVPPGEGIGASRTWLAVLVLAALATLLWYVVRNAPEASLFSF